MLRATLLFLSSLLFVSDNSLASNVVNTASVQYRDIPQSVAVFGRLAHKSEQKLSFKIQGIVASVSADEGQRVVSGQVLATLDQSEIQAQVKQATSVFNNNQENLTRFQSLYAEKVITQEQLQSAQTQFDVARSDLEIALFNQKHAEIRATNDGIILKRSIEQNELVNPNQPAFLISSEQHGWVLRVGVTDRDIVQLDEGNQANLHLDAYPDQPFSGVVSEIAAAANEQTGLFEVEIRLDKVSHKIYSGFIASASIVTSQTRRLALLPVEAMVSANGKRAEVFVLDDQQMVQKRRIALAYIQGNKIAIAEGLNDGENIVTDGAAYLRNGMSVDVAANRY